MLPGEQTRGERAAALLLARGVDDGRAGHAGQRARFGGQRLDQVAVVHGVVAGAEKDVDPGCGCDRPSTRPQRRVSVLAQSIEHGRRLRRRAVEEQVSGAGRDRLGGIRAHGGEQRAA